MRITISPKQASAGMMLASPIINENGLIVLEEGVVLTDVFIERLLSIGIKAIHVQMSDSIPPQQQFVAFYDETLDKIKEGFASITYFNEVPLAQMRELVDSSINPMVEIPGAMHHLSSIQQSDHYTFNHSMGVAVITGVFAKWAGYQCERLKDAILAGLLHDIGKMLIPMSILEKPDRLTEDEMAIVRKHSVEGCRLLAQAPTVSQEVLLGVLQHHERMDGGGYPFGHKADKIHPLARLISISDMYEAMTSKRSFRDRFMPLQVIQEINHNMFGKFDPELCLIFLNNTRESLVGSSVLLNDGRRATIINPGSFSGEGAVILTEDNEVLGLEEIVNASFLE